MSGEAAVGQAGGEPMEHLEDVEPALVTDGEPPEPGELGQRALDHPTMPAELLGAVDPAPRDPRTDASPATGATAPVAVVALVGVELAGAAARPSPPRPTGGTAPRGGLRSRLSYTFTAPGRSASRTPPASAIPCRSEPGLPRSVGFGPLSSPSFPAGTRRRRASSGIGRSRSPGPSGPAAPGAAAHGPRPPAGRGACASRSRRSLSLAPGRLTQGTPVRSTRAMPLTPCGRRGVDGPLSGAEAGRGPGGGDQRTERVGDEGFGHPARPAASLRLEEDLSRALRRTPPPPPPAPRPRSGIAQAPPPTAPA